MIKKLLPLLIFGFASLGSHAQDNDPGFWKIAWKKKVILQTGKSDQTANVRTIKASDLKKSYILEILYKENDPKMEKEWIRSFLFFDENDKELIRRDSSRHTKVSASQLSKLFGDKKKLKIYTIAIPSDPELAARIRVRRVHLCTLLIN
jgi:hypothetical protein